MRIVYFGTPFDAVPPLKALIAAGHDIALVVTQPDRRRGRRGNELVASPVKQAALELGLEIATPEKSREIVEQVAALEAELGVVVAFGQLLPPALLAATRSGFVNLHFSLLPRWRGAAPVERAMLAGDAETGVAVMEMEAGLDTGGIFAEVRVPILETMTAGTLRSELVRVGTELLVAEIDAVPGAMPVPQVGEPTYAHKLTVEEFRIDPALSAAALSCIVRAANPKPGAWAMIDGKRIKVLAAHVGDAAVDLGGTDDEGASGQVGAPSNIGTVTSDGALICGSGVLMLDEVQPDGKKAMACASWLAGVRGEVVLDA